MILAVILFCVGGVELVTGWFYADVSKWESTTDGTLVRVEHGRSSTYEFLFRVNESKQRMKTSPGANRSSFLSFPASDCAPMHSRRTEYSRLKVSND
jgi:hypothetical protein